MTPINQGRVVVITGAGRGIGREYALEFARTGAHVLVNDLGGAADGSGASTGPADEVVAEIHALGGQAVANGDDVADADGAARLIRTAVETFGGLDVVVNNAGILRDSLLVNMTDDDWDSVMRVHLRGTFLPTRAAASYWRDEAKAGRPREARLVNTSSSSGLFGNVGQANYGAAKAGIAAFTVIVAKELARYGVTANAVWPAALSRLTASLAEGNKEMASSMDPAFIAPVVAWLGSPDSKDVTGRLIGLRGRQIILAEGWLPGPEATTEIRWDAAELGPVMADLLARSRGGLDYRAGGALVGAQ